MFVLLFVVLVPSSLGWSVLWCAIWTIGGRKHTSNAIDIARCFIAINKKVVIVVRNNVVTNHQHDRVGQKETQDNPKAKSFSTHIRKLLPWNQKQRIRITTMYIYGSLHNLECVFSL